MKSLSGIVLRYLTTAALIAFLILFLNLFLYFFMGVRLLADHEPSQPTASSLAVSEQFSAGPDGPVLSEKGYELLRGSAWAMLLDEEGSVIWSWQLPDTLPRSYDVFQVASFTRWYLEDYPVTCRIGDCGLLVLAAPRDSLWKHQISFPLSYLSFGIGMIPVALLANVLLVILLVLLLGSRLYRSLRGIALGIERLSDQQPVSLPEQGTTALLARQINKTSRILLRQKTALDRRDDARTEWISGVSHDIRTPLSLIMGYAAALAADDSLTAGQRRQAALIESQSLQIRRLIEDLNLTSRLEYDMQPLRTGLFGPASLLRGIVSDFYNRGLSDAHSVSLRLAPAAEQARLEGDVHLLRRAFENLIGNSIRHNPDGCAVVVSAFASGDGLCFRISDDGCGIPADVLHALDEAPEAAASGQKGDPAPHIMGLRISCQIFRAHGWSVRFDDSRTISITASGSAVP
ncbi:MAG: HAMP domain-containing sensor histidine kinase [Eubacteriales bacterium]|nr:HAMP domain-containing sensor histidine kinase [Eubacteriales bacterium]